MYIIFIYIVSKMYRYFFEDVGFNNWVKCLLVNLLIFNLFYLNKWYSEIVKINL